MVDRVEEAVGAKSVAKLRCELGTSLWGVCFGQVDDGEISKVH